MFEHITFESILKRMLEKIPNNMDKREGSVIYDALAPAAVEIQNIYIELDTILKESFADTASFPFLVRRAAERGVKPYEATKATLKAISKPADVEVPIGSRFSLNELNYIVIKKIQNGEYQVECESVGVTGNTYFGNAIPIDYIQGLQTFTISELLIPAEDAETVEELRKRYFDNMLSQAYGGNIRDYEEKTMSILGVGGVKVKPTWNGGGTVKLIFIDSTFSKPSTELITKVQNTIDPVGHSGLGYGVAPIGHIVTVEGVDNLLINITTDITYESGWAWVDCEAGIKKAIDDYFKELSKTWMTQETLIVRISQLESKILDVAGVLDVMNTTLNGSVKNLYLTEKQIPVRGVVNGK